jgi:deoxyxylulose-5-phosphate synthase
MNAPTVEQIAQHIKAMGDSVTVINAEIAKPFTEEISERVKANVDHLTLMLAKDFIIADSGSKESFTDAIEKGQTFLDDNA